MRRRAFRSGRRRGFTLVELLIVISIIGILIAVFLPAITAALSYADRIDCQSNLRAIASAVHTFSATNGGAVLPTSLGTGANAATWPIILIDNGFIEAPNTVALHTRNEPVSTKTRNVFRCPSGVDAPGGTPTATDGAGGDLAQGFWRTGSATYKVDCWYYWNGTEQLADGTNNVEPTYDVPSAATLSATPTYGYREAIRRPSQMAMVTDGYATNGPFVPNGKYRIAARHWGDRGFHTATNIAYWDGHVGTLQRNINRNPPLDQQDPITSRGADLKSSTGPFFRLSDQH